ncbi:uncharacterized protein SAZU_7464 [Streptomyces azureus]|uniref:Uncharacterized protein n=1 Tax=Streptomyces azureus TaxID=146537 RepID=A0A0K8PXD7_STRAJ|nr:uncharacterized protein SAZU_7464 [Streptomyces azureus]
MVPSRHGCGGHAVYTDLLRQITRTLQRLISQIAHLSPMRSPLVCLWGSDLAVLPGRGPFRAGALFAASGCFGTAMADLRRWITLAARERVLISQA